MSCLRIEEIYGYLEAQLSAEDIRRVETHLRFCASCREALKDRQAFQRAADSLAPIPVPRDFAAAVMNRLPAVPAPPRRVRAWIWPTAIAAGVSSFFLTLGGIALITGQDPGSLVIRAGGAIMSWLQVTAHAGAKLVKYILIAYKVIQEMAHALMDVLRRAASIVGPEALAAFGVGAVLLVGTGVFLWKRRWMFQENSHEK